MGLPIGDSRARVATHHGTAARFGHLTNTDDVAGDDIFHDGFAAGDAPPG